MWYKSERQPGTDKLEPMWRGPGVVVGREGHFSYVVEWSPGKRQHAHRSQLKRHIADQYNGTPFPLYNFSGRAPEVEVSPDDWPVEAIQGHRNSSRGLEFLVKWEGWDPSDQTWEPLASFFPQYNPKVLEYCKQQGLNPHIRDLVSRNA